MESASDRRRRLARERLQRCHIADIKLFFPLAFSYSRSPAYVRTPLLVTIQIFVVVLVVVFVVYCNWFFPANHKSVSVLFLFTCILYCIAFLLLREAFLRMRIPSIIIYYYTRYTHAHRYTGGTYTLGVHTGYTQGIHKEYMIHTGVYTGGTQGVHTEYNITLLYIV